MKKALFLLTLLAISITVNAESNVTTFLPPSNSAGQLPGRVPQPVSDKDLEQAVGCIYKTHCGTAGITVTLEFFDGDINEFMSYLREISEIECGDFGPISFDCH